MNPRDSRGRFTQPTPCPDAVLRVKRRHHATTHSTPAYLRLFGPCDCPPEVTCEVRRWTPSPHWLDVVVLS